jgi:hypothetical protein
MAKPTGVALIVAPLLAAAALLASGIAGAAPETEDRVIRAAAGGSGDRDANGRLDPHKFAEIRTSAADTAAMSKGSGPLAAESLAAGDHWIYDADVALYDDFDGDGYYRFLSVRIDADTFFNRSFVYAVIYLSDDGENFEHFYSTDDFEINGATSDDEYFVETELVSGYPTGEYDVLIELYDADTGVYMDEFGPAQSAALEVLPLEDARFDEPPVVIIVDEHGGGGAISWWMLAGLLGAAAVRRGSGLRVGAASAWERPPAAIPKSIRGRRPATSQNSLRRRGPNAPASPD